MASRIQHLSCNFNSKKKFQPAERIEVFNLNKHGFLIVEIGRQLNISSLKCEVQC